MASNSSTPASRFRQKCFLCDVPRGPWAMLADFSEAICRACCNYEGIDRIEEVIERARQQKKQAEALLARAPTTTTVAVDTSGGRFAQRPGEVVEMVHTPTGTLQAIPCSEPGSIPVLNQYVVSTSAKMGSNNSPSTVHRTMAAAPTRMIPVGTAPASLMAVAYHGPGGGAPQQRSDAITIPEQSQTQKIQLINDTLTTLSKCSPFRVRFSKDHSLVGRAFAFDAVCRGSEYELKVYIEYQIGSGRVFQSASGAGRQMYGEFRQRLGIGGGFKGASSNGYKDLEFEKTHNADDWRVLGELLTEDVRFFRGPLRQDLLPAPFIDPKYPYLPIAQLNASRGFSRNPRSVPIVRKRPSGSDEESEGKKPRSPSTPNSENDVSPARSPNNVAKSPDSSSPLSSTRSGKQSPGQTMHCMLCNKTLEDTRFVQCPSVSSHKFCFTCSRESIKKQSAASTDIYCPSGHKCLVMGSSTPWAFMETEIATILETANQ